MKVERNVNEMKVAYFSQYKSGDPQWIYISLKNKLKIQLMNVNREIQACIIKTGHFVSNSNIDEKAYYADINKLHNFVLAR